VIAVDGDEHVAGGVDLDAGRAGERGAPSPSKPSSPVPAKVVMT